MTAAPALLVGVYFISFALPSQGRLVKRIANGNPLWSQDNYGTYHFVQLRKSFGCISDQWVHELGGCQERMLCGGTLFHPEFVITAAHCVSYVEFYQRSLSQVLDIKALLGGGDFPKDIGYEGLVERNVTVFSVLPKFKHGFYSNFAWLAGSVDYASPTQKRHAYKMFPHPRFGYGNFSLLDHDVAVVQVCEAFEITANVKTAPMLPLHELPSQWQNIVERSAACLYVGFGYTNDSSTKFTVGSNYWVPTRYLRYTWRHVTCSSYCNYNRTAGWDQKRNPCLGCSRHIRPRVGGLLGGDSGTPIMCDSLYIGLHSGGYYIPTNYSLSYIYPLHCIRETLAPESLDYYRTASETKYHSLWPIVIRG